MTNILEDLARTARVLIAEDDESLVLLLQYNLRRCGFDVETMSNGGDVEKRLRESPPDLLILDWGLPALAGIEILRRIRVRGGSPYVPAIMLTARCDREHRRRAIANGVDVFLAKPFQMNELLSHAVRLTNANSSCVASSEV